MTSISFSFLSLKLERFGDIFLNEVSWLLVFSSLAAVAVEQVLICDWLVELAASEPRACLQLVIVELHNWTAFPFVSPVLTIFLHSQSILPHFLFYYFLFCWLNCPAYFLPSSWLYPALTLSPDKSCDCNQTYESGFLSSIKAYAKLPWQEVTEPTLTPVASSPSSENLWLKASNKH